MAEWMVSYQEMIECFQVAMQAEGLPATTIESILATVEDAAVNNLGDD